MKVDLYNPAFSPTWKRVPLYSLADWVNGMAFKDIHFSETGKPVIKIAEIKNGITPQTQFTDATYNENIHIASGNMLFAWSGQPETSIGVFVWHGEDGWLNQHIFKVLSNGACTQKFLLFLLRYLNPTFVKIGRNKQTTGLGHVTKADMRLLQVGVPEKTEQDAIVGLLEPLENKIELLRQQNETLEQIARTAFDEWFEKSTSDGVLPDGWRIYNVADIADVISGYSYKGADLVESSTDALVNLKNFDRNGGFKTDGMKPLHGSPKKNHEVQLGDLIVAHTDLTQDAEVLGNAALVMEKAGFEHLYISMDVAKVIPKTPLSAASLYFLMTTRRFKQHCVGYANGTTVLHLPRVAVPQYMVVLPADLHSQILSDFNLLAQATTQGIASNLDKIQTLTKIRDLLLPRLMNGEVCVQE